MNIPNINPPGPGGRLVDALQGINALANNMDLRDINRVKAQYAPLTTKADAFSKIAYANAVGPQILNKILTNDASLANLEPGQGKNALNRVLNAGMMGGDNLFQQFNDEGSNANNSLSGWLTNKLKDSFSGNQQGQGQNPLSYNGFPEPGMSYKNDPNRQGPMADPTANGNALGPNEDPNEYVKYNNPRSPDYNPSAYGPNTGNYKADIKQREELGKYRADAVNRIGQEQSGLSSTGANLDILLDQINQPEFRELRNTIPGFQDTQLWALSKIGTPEEQEMIGEFTANAKSYVAATVAAMGTATGQKLDFADSLKVSDNDTVDSMLGKMRALKTLKDIQQTKNDIKLDLIENRGLNEGQANKEADKRVDIKGIQKHVKDVTQPLVGIKNKKTGQTIYVSKKKAQEMMGGG